MSRIEREKRTVSMMIALYCRHKLGLSELPEEYRALEEYAHRRLDGCKFGDAWAYSLRLAVTPAPLIPKLRGQFAEFLNNASPAGLRILSSSTCVGLRYGY